MALASQRHLGRRAGEKPRVTNSNPYLLVQAHGQVPVMVHGDLRSAWPGPCRLGYRKAKLRPRHTRSHYVRYSIRA